MAHVFVLGIAVLDHVFYLPEMPRRAAKFRADGYDLVVGGCAATAAATIVRLGGRARLAARLGDDPNSDAIAGALTAAGVDVSLARRTPGARAPVSNVLVDADGERQIVNFRGAHLDTGLDWLGPDAIAGCAAVLVDTRWPEAAARALGLAREAGVPGIVDAEPPFEGAGEMLAAASHLAFPADGVRLLAGTDDLAAGLTTLRERHDAWLAVTDGADGVRFTDGDAIAHEPALRVDVRDSLGAGDVWHGALALALAEKREARAAVRFANAVAALKCANGTGWEAIPDRAATERLVAG